MAFDCQIRIRKRLSQAAPKVSFAAIILAAGASRRMGTPKALLEYRGETFVDRLVGVFAAHCSPVAVVLGHDGHAIRSGMRRGDLTAFVENPNPELGQLSSLQCGLRALHATAKGIFLIPVDCPAVLTETIGTLIEHFGSRTFVVPSYCGKHGHPILFQTKMAAQFLALPVDSSAREVVHRYRDLSKYVEVADPGILRDVDDRMAYHDLLQAADS